MKINGRCTRQAVTIIIYCAAYVYIAMWSRIHDNNNNIIIVGAIWGEGWSFGCVQLLNQLSNKLYVAYGWLKYFLIFILY